MSRYTKEIKGRGHGLPSTLIKRRHTTLIFITVKTEFLHPTDTEGVREGYVFTGISDILDLLYRFLFYKDPDMTILSECV